MSRILHEARIFMNARIFNFPHRTGNKHNGGSDTSFNKNKHHTSRLGLGFIISIVGVDVLLVIDSDRFFRRWNYCRHKALKVFEKIRDNSLVLRVQNLPKELSIQNSI